MAGRTDVFLITGFLGSGKTTFLNRIIKVFPQDRKLMILMNEFGDIGLDGALVENNDLDMLEISKGSIFCVCVKTDFIKGLMNIAQSVQPDVLVIEATGVANPTDLKRDLNLSIFKNRFQFREQFCLIDAANFEDAYDTFTSVEKQIESATVFIINKIDEAKGDVIARVKQIVARHHPDPAFLETTYADIPLENYLPKTVQTQPRKNDALTTDPLKVSPEALDRFIDTLLTDPGISMTPPDLLLSKTFRWTGKTLNQLNVLSDRIPAALTRAKGVVRIGEDAYLFNCVMGQSKIEKIIPGERMRACMNKLVFIAPPGVIDQVNRTDFKGILMES